MKEILSFLAGLLGLTCIIGLIAVWPFNLYKLTQCNWDNDNWKPEVIHTIGVVVPPASVVTVWFECD